MFELTMQPKPNKETIVASETKKPRRATVLKRHNRNMYRRAYGETVLLDITEDDNFKDGDCYNYITGGDVDGLSFLRLILRKQNIKHLLFSTWCMASEDIYELEEWLEEGKIKKIDAYVGEIFPGTYKLEYAFLKRVINKYGGDVCVFKNHSKIFAGEGDDFSFGIQSSANINTNPRTENACIQIGEDIYNFYNDYFKGVNSFE